MIIIFLCSWSQVISIPTILFGSPRSVTSNDSKITLLPYYFPCMPYLFPHMPFQTITNTCDHVHCCLFLELLGSSHFALNSYQVPIYIVPFPLSDQSMSVLSLLSLATFLATVRDQSLTMLIRHMHLTSGHQCDHLASMCLMFIIIA